MVSLAQTGVFAPPRAASALDHVESMTFTNAGYVFGRFGAAHMSSVFQPIYSLPHRRLVGLEALLRASDGAGQATSPMSLFSRVRHEQDVVLLDRLCRDVHVRNQPELGTPYWLFLNVHPLTVARGVNYGAFFRDLLHKYGVPPSRVVVEITEACIDDERMLEEAVLYYRELGALIAIDDFGTGNSNFGRIWRLRPDIVKLDRSIIAMADQHLVKGRILTNLVDLIREAGALVLMEGVETEQEARIAMEAGADLVQGYYFSRPRAHWDQKDLQSPVLNQLFDNYWLARQQVGCRVKEVLDLVGMQLRRASVALGAGLPATAACQSLLQLARVERCFLLDDQGYQISANLESRSRGPADVRFAPLFDTEGAAWCRRSYFQQAIQSLGEVQISRPYRSISGGNLCVTLSIAFDQKGQQRVLCCDVDWSTLE